MWVNNAGSLLLLPEEGDARKQVRLHVYDVQDGFIVRYKEMQ
jgi:hypothetical protein